MLRLCRDRSPYFILVQVLSRYVKLLQVMSC
jgi:hypothetical protein